MRRMVLATALASACALVGQSVQAATVFTNANANGYWFDNANWSSGLTPPTDMQLNYGYNYAGEGVVFDPATDPNAPSPTATHENFRFYLSYTSDPLATGVSTTNKITVKSGTLRFTSQARLGRTNNSVNYFIQTGGTVDFNNASSDAYMTLGDASGSQATYDYRGGTFQFALGTGYGTNGVRLGGGGGTTGTFITHNPITGGAVQVENYLAGYNSTGIGISEFHYANGGTRAIQVAQQFSLRNGADPLTRSARLNLVLDSAPIVDGLGVPVDLGLFALGPAAQYTGNGSEPQRFYSADGSTLYDEGATVSAIFGSNTYNWTITYTGKINFSDANNSVISSILGPGNGIDVVLVGLSSTVVPEPAALGLLAAGLGTLALRRRRR